MPIGRPELACVAVAALSAAPAFAQTPAAERISFQIPAGPLGAALNAYGQQSGLQLMFGDGLVAGRTSPGLTGRFTREEALSRLLEGLAVEIRRRPGLVVLKAPPKAGELGEGAPASAVEGAAAVGARAGGEAPVVDVVVVTGTLIRGAAAGPSPVITLSRDALDRAGYATVAEALSALPQSFNGTNTPQGELLGSDGLGVNLAASTGVNLRGLGANATLVLVNGRRLAGSGVKGDFADISAIPAAAVDHIEILLDGASALYGSDAVGGVVNIILRADFSGAETRARYGAARDGDHGQTIIGQTLGHAWSDGHALLSYEYEHTDRLAGADRASTASADLRPLGGTDHRLFYSHPGNLLAFDPATSGYVAAYGIPPGQDGTALKQGDFLAGAPNLENYRAGADVLPEQERHSLYLDVAQSFGPRFDLDLQARYTRRTVDFNLPEALSAFQVTPANPYYVSPDGSPSEIIGYAFGDAIGPGRNRGLDENFGASLAAGWSLGRTWRLEASADYAQDESRLVSTGLVNSGYLDEALGNAPDDPATPYSAARDGYFNPYAAGAAASPAVLQFIGSGSSTTRALSRDRSLNLKADGELLNLPGGPVKLAIGWQLRTDSFHTSSLTVAYGPDPIATNGPIYRRTITAGFAELRVPLVGAANALPFVSSLELSLAGRVEHYSDAGTTGNPKLGLTWKPIADLKFRASYGTSFRAPGLTEIDAVQQVAPSFAQRGTTQVLTLIEYGGNPDLKPETATTWTTGFDVHPARLPGLTLSATWFDTRFEDRIGEPVLEDFSNALIDPGYSPFVTLVDPAHNAADLARVQAVLGRASASVAQIFPASSYGAIVDARYSNTSSLHVAGLDLTAAYTLQRGRDRFDLAFNASYLAHYQRRLTSASPEVDLVGQPGQVADLRLRVSGGWARGPYGATLGLNFVDGSTDLSGKSVDSWTTVDLQLQWKAPATSGPLSGLSLSLTAQNLLDADPPFYDSPRAVGYDPANADPLGRVLSIQLVKRW